MADTVSRLTFLKSRIIELADMASRDKEGEARALAAELRACGARVVLAENDDGDEVGLWRTRPPALLRSLLPADG